MQDVNGQAREEIEAKVQEAVAKQRSGVSGTIRKKSVREKLARYETVIRERYLAEYMAAAREK
jgi:hypothetical protein